MALLRFPHGLVGCVTLAAALAACNGNGDATGSESDGESESAGTDTGGLPEGCDAFIEPSDDDQTAVQGALIDAAEGATVCLGAGTFHFNTEVTITKTGVTLRGAGATETILDFSMQDLGANGVLITADDVIIEHLQVLDSAGDGIRANDVLNITFRDMGVEWTADASLDNGAYGLYPVGCTGVTIQRAWVKGARDAGVYVGQSTKILVEDSEAYGNVAGIEIENSTDATVRNNHAHDNTAGLLIFNLPGLPVKDGKRTNAYGNNLENNNLANFAEKGTIVAEVPYGIGLLILASDGNEIHDNMISNNESLGVALVSYNTNLFEPYDDPDFDPYAQGNFIHDNAFDGNGTNPDLLILAISGNMDPPMPDIVDDGCSDPALMNVDNALTNCLSNNGAATFYMAAMCGGSPSDDINAVTCTHANLPDLPE
ncbi:MAG: right-handed parallel beta-helix repeat-containing protein [Myxococcales bacterium]|nr:right-handed parallel beta-helix repeat-containing protein [Myxococcales bacterium]MCB9567848.1 right-handed parallel beta-helix repeat-containing protein [Myxococcales bacterium]MCB9700293.1 right-handed parallel beta-helix repeat-containing protein [Myxococcales bacterium]